MSDTKSVGCGGALPWLLVILLAYFKMTTHPEMSWWIVTAPIWIPLAIIAAFVAAFVLLLIMGSMAGR